MDQRRQSSRIRGITPSPLPPLPRSIRRRRSPPLPPPRPAGAVPLLVPNLPIPSVDGEQSPTLPLDVILEIAARSDAVSIVRCAATSKPLRLASLAQWTNREAASPCGAVVNSAEPALVGFTQFVDLEVDFHFEPVACRDGLVVLRRWCRDIYSLFRSTHSGPVHRVFNGITGRISHIPAPDIINHNKHALLSVGDRGGSFELLIVGATLQTLQLYSSRDGRWGPVRTIRPTLPFFRLLDGCYPVVIGRTAHWLLCTPYRVVAVHAGMAQATLIELPFTGRMDHPFTANRSLILGASPDEKLMAVVSERMVISMWTLEGEPSRSGTMHIWSNIH
ncbi:hypothetical protein BRADI_2g09561v3 [Brachypodium distachyon]|uniref:DUF7595 domain-containing protein n=1 Tax=Brachypodium distachyon TaxID=15368 RepID=A0A0Q3QQK1_BRADI|nr:hypothetical protein BRADI_2g09561v3 [Brachypodium distachyon]